MTTLNKIVSIIDDEQDIVCLFKDALQDALQDMNEFSVVTFTDPTLALEHFKENKSNYALVLSDYKMPCISGMDLIKQIKQVNPTVRTLLMTAIDIDNQLIQQYTAKKILDGCLQKPIRIKELDRK